MGNKLSNFKARFSRNSIHISDTQSVSKDTIKPSSSRSSRKSIDQSRDNILTLHPSPSTSTALVNPTDIYEALRARPMKINRKRVVPIPNRINFFNCTVPARLISLVDGDTFLFLVAVSSLEKERFTKADPSKHYVFSETCDSKDLHYYMFKVRLMGFDAYESNTYFGLLAFIVCISLFSTCKVKLRTQSKFDNWSRILSDVLYYDEHESIWKDYGSEVLGKAVHITMLQSYALQASKFIGRNISIKSIPAQNILLGIPYQGKGQKAAVVKVEKGLKEKYNFIKRHTNYILCGESSKGEQRITSALSIQINPDIISADLVTIT